MVEPILIDSIQKLVMVMVPNMMDETKYLSRYSP
jgi:hypothetical protein